MLGSILTWLLQPNNIVLPALASLGVWVWHRLRGEKAATWQDALTGAVSTIAQEAITRWVPGGTVADGLAFVRAYVEKNIWDVASKRNIPRNALTEPVVHAAVEQATAGLVGVIAQRLLPPQLGRLADAAAGVKDAFIVDQRSPLAQVGRDIGGAMVQREPFETTTPPPAK